MPMTSSRRLPIVGPKGDSGPSGVITVTVSPTLHPQLIGERLPDRDARQLVRPAARRAPTANPTCMRSRTSVTSPSVAGSMPLTVMNACCSPAVTSALPSTIGEAPVTRGTCFSRRMSPCDVGQPLAHMPHVDVRRRADDAVAQFALQPGHQRERDDQRHHADRDPRRRNDRNQRQERLLAAGDEVAEGEEEFEGHQGRLRAQAAATGYMTGTGLKPGGTHAARHQQAPRYFRTPTACPRRCTRATTCSYPSSVNSFELGNQLAAGGTLGAHESGRRGPAARALASIASSSSIALGSAAETRYLFTVALPTRLDDARLREARLATTRRSSRVADCTSCDAMSRPTGRSHDERAWTEPRGVGRSL